MKVYVIRHAQSIGNEQRIHCGQRRDLGLSELGKKQAKEVANFFKDIHIETIYSSDSLRAKDTAKELSKLNKAKIIEDKRLREFDKGDMFEVEWSECVEYKKKRMSEKNLSFEEVVFPNGESEVEHKNRIEAFLKEALNENKGNIVIFAHAGTNRLIHAILLKMSFEEAYSLPQKNACINEFEKVGKKWRLNFSNKLDHLS